MLRNNEGEIKVELLQEALDNLLIKDIDDKSLLPDYFVRNIKLGKADKLANSSINEIQRLDENKSNSVFEKSSLPVLKAMDKYRELVVASPDRFYQQYLKQIPIPILSESKFADSFIVEIQNIIDECLMLIDLKIITIKEKDKLDRLFLFLQGHSYADISSVFHETRENSRINVKNNILVDILCRRSNFYLNEYFYTALQSFKEQYLLNDLFTSELNNIENNGLSLEIVKNRLEIIGLNIIELTIDDAYHYFIIDGDVTLYRPYFNSMVQFLKNIYAEKDFEELFSEFIIYYKNQKSWNESLSNDVVSFQRVLKSSFIQSIYDENLDKELFMIDWYRLASMELRVGKILLDANLPMSTEDIFDEYNKRCVYYDILPLSDISKLFVRSNSYTYNIRNGYWIYSLTPLEEYGNTQELISQFLIDKNGEASFNDIKQYLCSKNLIYPDPTIRAYILLNARNIITDKNFFVHHSFINSTTHEVVEARNSNLGATLLPIIVNAISNLKHNISKKDFLKLVQDICIKSNIPLKREASIHYYLRKLVDEEILSYEKDYIDISKIQNEKLKLVKYRAEPDYREFIRNEAVVMLKEHSSNLIRTSFIWNKLKYLFPKDIAVNNFYKIFDLSNLFIKSKDDDGKLFYSLNYENIPAAKPLNETVPAPDTFEIISNEHVSISPRPLDYPKYEQQILSVDQIFDFIEKELYRKYREFKWDIQYGLQVFKSFLYEKQEKEILTTHGEMLMKSLGRVLMNFSDYFDRDSCMQRLALTFEAYIKEITTLSEIKGLGSLVNGHSELRQLRNYKENSYSKYDRDHLQYTFSVKLNSIIYYRNLYSHDQSHKNLDMPFDDHIKNIMDFIALYAYVPYYVNNFSGQESA